MKFQSFVSTAPVRYGSVLLGSRATHSAPVGCQSDRDAKPKVHRNERPGGHGIENLHQYTLDTIPRTYTTKPAL